MSQGEPRVVKREDLPVVTAHFYNLMPCSLRQGTCMPVEHGTESKSKGGMIVNIMEPVVINNVLMVRENHGDPRPLKVGEMANIKKVQLVIRNDPAEWFRVTNLLDWGDQRVAAYVRVGAYSGELSLEKAFGAESFDLDDDFVEVAE